MRHRNAVCTDGGCTVAVATRVAEKDGIDPLELPPLHEVIDATALDRLLSAADDSVEVQFIYAGYDVTVSGDGVVQVRDKKDRDG